MKLNNKGFTLVELLAVVVLLSILVAIMVPSVDYLIDKSREDNYENLKKNIILASKVYLSDNRYNISLDYGDTLCGDGEVEENILSINGVPLTASKLPIRVLVENKALTTDSNGNITDPRNKDKILDIINEEGSEESYILKESYIIVKYQCSNKEYSYILEDEYLIWE